MEYVRCGAGWVRRPDADKRWKPVSEDDVPDKVKAGVAAAAERAQRIALHGYDPEERTRGPALLADGEEDPNLEPDWDENADWGEEDENQGDE